MVGYLYRDLQGAKQRYLTAVQVASVCVVPYPSEKDFKSFPTKRAP